MLPKNALPPYHPLFSHAFPCTSALPGSDFSFSLFPACLEIHGPQPLVLPFAEESRFQSHTTILNFLSGVVLIEGKTPAGFQRLRLYNEANTWYIRAEKRPVSFPSLSLDKGQPLKLFQETQEAPGKARLVLTSPKKMRWESLTDRADWKTILEQWYLCSYVPLAEEKSASLTEEDVIDLVTQGFSGMSVPRVDPMVNERFGKIFWHFASQKNNLSCLQAQIRSLFIKEEGEQLTLLPNLLPSLSSGQLIHEVCMDNAVHLSFHWRKKRVCCIVLEADRECSMRLSVPESKAFRCRVAHQKGVQTKSIEDTLVFEPGKQYLLDSFT